MKTIKFFLPFLFLSLFFSNHLLAQQYAGPKQVKETKKLIEEIRDVRDNFNGPLVPSPTGETYEQQWAEFRSDCNSAIFLLECMVNTIEEYERLEEEGGADSRFPRYTMERWKRITEIAKDMLEPHVYL